MIADAVRHAFGKAYFRHAGIEHAQRENEQQR